MDTENITVDQSLITTRNIAEWNREVIDKMRKLNLEISGNPINLKRVLMYALNTNLREQKKFEEECAMKAVIFLEWLEKKYQRE